MKIEVRGWKKLFSAENPEKLEQMLENKKQAFKKHLPDFLSLYNLKESESLIRFYEGKEAVKSVYEDLLKSIRPFEDYLILTNMELWLGLGEKFCDDFMRRRAKLNVKTRLLLQDTPSAWKYKKIERNLNQKIKILPKDININTNLVIIPQKIVNHQLTTPVSAIVIENKNIANLQKEIFEMLWKTTGN